MMSNMLIKPPIVTNNGSTACLKVYNTEGVELSLSFDDSCGKKYDLSRNTMALFKDDMADKAIAEKRYVTPEEFLASLAKLLGYDIIKM